MPHWKKTNRGIEYAIVNKARGLKRGERGQSWEDPRYNKLVSFREGQFVCVDPFTDSDGNARCLWPLYCKFVRYVTPEIAEIEVAGAEEDSHCWFKAEPGNYYIHEKYLTPQ